jgi:hypothetical protein
VLAGISKRAAGDIPIHALADASQVREALVALSKVHWC